MDKKKYNINEIQIEQLIFATENKFGRVINTHKDCELLAESIFTNNQRRVGVTTLRRLFKIDPSKNFPSYYTLDTLAIYVGYNTWYDFVEYCNNSNSTNEVKKSDVKNTMFYWDEIKTNAKSISEYNLKNIQKKSGLNLKNAIERKITNTNLINFLNSNFVATALIAPGGYGKSMLLLKAYQLLWNSDEALYPDDIVWFIDASILNGLLSKGFDFSSWLNSMIGLETSSNIRTFFRDNEDLRKGRMILIIDSIDDATFRLNRQNEIFNSISNLIVSIDDTPWFKIILSMRNHTWAKFVDYHRDFTYLKNQFYGVVFNVFNEDTTNIPPFSEAEILSIVNNLYQNINPELFEKIDNIVFSGDFLDSLSFPFYLQLFLQNICEKNIVPNTDTEIIVEYFRLKILGGMLGEQKMQVIDEILKEMDYGLNGTAIKKKRLIERCDFKELFKAYQELISYGIIFEENNYNKYGALTTFVKFFHKNVLDFFVASKYFEGINEHNSSIFEVVLRNYNNYSNHLEIICWMLKLCFYNKLYDVIFDFKSVLRNYKKEFLNEQFTYRSYFWEIIKTIGISLRHDPEARNNLIPRFAADMEWQSFYFQTFIDFDYLVISHVHNINYFIIYKRTPNAILFGHSLLLFSNILINNDHEARKQIQILESVQHDTAVIHPILLGRSIAFRMIYYYLFENSLPLSLLTDIENIEKSIHSFNIAPDYLPAYYSLLIFGYSFTQDYKKILQLSDKAFPEYKDAYLSNIIPEIELAKLFIAEAYLEIGNYSEGLKLINDYHGVFFRATHTHYNIFYYYVKAKFLLHDGIINEAKEYINKSLTLAHKLRYYSIENEIEKRIWKSNLTFHYKKEQ